MNDAIVVEAATKMDKDIVEAMARLLPQLSRSAPIPTPGQLQEILSSPSVILLLARDVARGGEIVGMLTLVVFRIPTGVRAWIENVVVDATARGKGAGEALSREALLVAALRGARTVELTSKPSREAANRLYRRLGFELRETNVYRYSSAGEG